MKKILPRLAILSLLLFPLAAVGFRLNLWDFSDSFKMLGAAGVLAASVFLISLLISLIKRDNVALVKQTRVAMLIALVPLLLLGSQVMKARSVPSIHNISTDTEQPPQFDKVIALRGEGSNPLEYDAEALAEVQKAAYPKVKTLMLSEPLDTVFERARENVTHMGWDLVSVDKSSGRIEATVTTALWGFKDDVVIRVEPVGEEQIAVDLRSVSRIGQSDLGANAQRIEEFLERLTK